MGKRPRTPHFITGIGDGKVHDGKPKNDDVYALRGNRDNRDANHQDRYDLRSHRHNNFQRSQDEQNRLTARNEILHRIEDPKNIGPADPAWASFHDPGSDIPNMDIPMDIHGLDIDPPLPSTGPWQVSALAFYILGVLVVIGIVLHFLSEYGEDPKHSTKTKEKNRHHSGNHSRPYQYRRRQRQRRMQKLRKKKTDEWSDDEEPIQDGAGLFSMSQQSFALGNRHRGDHLDGGYGSPNYPYDYENDYNDFENEYRTSSYSQSDYYRQPDSHLLGGQEINHRRPGTSSSSKEAFDCYASGGPGSESLTPNHRSAFAAHALPTYKASKYVMPSATHSAFRSNAHTATTPQRGVSPMSSYSSGGGSSRQRLRSGSSPRWEGKNKYGNYSSSSSNSHKNTPYALSKNRLKTSSSEADSFCNSQSPILPKRTADLGARLLPDSGSRFSSFASIVDNDLPAEDFDGLDAPNRNDTNYEENESATGIGGYGDIETFDEESNQSQRSNPHPSKRLSPSLSAFDDSFSSTHGRPSTHQDSLVLTPGNCEETPIIGNARKTIQINDDSETSLDVSALMPLGSEDAIPFIPSLKISEEAGLSPPRLASNAPSVTLDELRLLEMETGNSKQWDIQQERLESSGQHEEESPSFAISADVSSKNDTMSEEGSDISIPSGDPRKGIVHKRQNLTMSTDAATSLQSSINFDELQLQEVIGGGGFGQVWKANWRGTPVAVKILTGSAQNTHIAKAILEEFKAEINLLKGMRHPNICLYMGACMTPPNRAIITELAANGSAWDSLRLPLMPPYIAADGTINGSWPLSLYLPGRHGLPPSSHVNSEISAPIPPKGSWPWELVKRVSCGAARGMAYLHSGHPPVLHRDLKSANLLLDESYNAKVCDFGLSRLKAQARSMTANCGTVQWMAPEVLANRSYDEKADVYSFGIIVWELLSRECPYEGMTAIQCALAVLNRDKRPDIPKWCPPGLHALIKSCIKKEPSERPSFTEIIITLDAMG